MPLHATQNVHKVTIHVTCLKIFQSKNGISRDIIPESIILGSPNPDYNRLKITLGEYTQVYIGTTNSKNRRTVGTIELSPEN